MHFDVYSKYFYTKLTPQEKSAYDKLLRGWLDYKEKIIINGLLSSNSFQKIFDALRADNPELFYIDTSKISITGVMGAFYINVKFLYRKSECEQYKEQINVIIANLIKSATSSSDKIQFLHDYLAKTVEYAADMSASELYNIIGPFLKKQAVCEGYSLAFKLLCDVARIPCIIVSGTATNLSGYTENHAWNIVRNNGSNYHVDTTWDSPSAKSGGMQLYYCVSDVYLRRDHKWDENKWPRCQTEGLIEKNSVQVTGPNKLCEVLKLSIKNRTNQVRLIFNRTFSSSDEIMNMVASAMNKISSVAVAQYSCQFSGRYDQAVIAFQYR